MENKLITICKSEYDELIKKAETPVYQVTISFRSYNGLRFYPNTLKYKGNEISGSLYARLHNILNNVLKKANELNANWYQNNMQHNADLVGTYREMITEFNNLPWYKKMFYKFKTDSLY